MAFTRDFLPPRACMPCSSPARSEDFSPSGPLPRTTRVRLVHVLPAVLRVMSVVMDARIRAGDAFLAHAARAAGPVCLAEVAEALPVPALTVVHSDFYGNAYAAAMAGARSPFDSLETDVNPSLDSYLVRLADYGGVSNAVFMTVMIYMDRLCSACPAVILCSKNVHRILAAAFVLATKFHEDRHTDMASFAVLVGLSVSEICSLEASLLERIRYRCFVTVDQFAAAEKAFMAEAVDTPAGMTVIGDLYTANVLGISDALDCSKTWKTCGEEGRGEAAWEGDGNLWANAKGWMEGGLQPTVSCLFSEGDVWRPPASQPSGQRDAWDRATNLRALASAQLEQDFPAIEVNPLFAREEEAEWQVLGLCEESGLRRFRILRALARGLETTVTLLPPLGKRPEPFAELARSGFGFGGNGGTLGSGVPSHLLSSGGWAYPGGGLRSLPSANYAQGASRTCTAGSFVSGCWDYRPLADARADTVDVPFPLPTYESLFSGGMDGESVDLQPDDRMADVVPVPAAPPGFGPPGFGSPKFKPRRNSVVRPQMAEQVVPRAAAWATAGGDQGREYISLYGQDPIHTGITASLRSTEEWKAAGEANWYGSGYAAHDTRAVFRDPEPTVLNATDVSDSLTVGKGSVDASNVHSYCSPTRVMGRWYQDGALACDGNVPVPHLRSIPPAPLRGAGFSSTHGVHVDAPEMSEFGQWCQERWMRNPAREGRGPIGKGRRGSRITVKDMKKMSGGNVKTFVSVMSRLNRH